jgi:hypothetical protein
VKNTYLLANAFFLLLIACGSANNQATEKSSNPDKTPASSINTDATDKKGTISFKVNGELVKTSVWNASTVTSMVGVGILNITSNMKQDTRNISININGRWNGFKPGEYPLTHGLRRIDTTHGIAYGSYRPEYKKILESYHFVSGSFIIKPGSTDKIINASFSGKVQNDKGEEMEITEGQVINAVTKSAIPPGAIN